MTPLNLNQTVLTLDLVDELSEGMEELRTAAYAGPGDTASYRDTFDGHSLHLVAGVEGEPVGMVRLTTSPPWVFDSWFSPDRPAPKGAGVFELTRAAVTPPLRRQGLLRLLVAGALLHAQGLGARCVVGTIRFDVPWRACLERLGFAVCTASGVSHDAPRQTPGSVIIACDLRRGLCGRVNTFHAALGAVEAHGYRVLSRFRRHSPEPALADEPSSGPILEAPAAG